MDEESTFPASHWGIGRLLLVAGVCFAIVAIVFFVSTWLQKYGSGDTNQNTTVPMSDEDKRGVVDSLSATTSANEISPEEKLEILESLNAN